MILVNMDGSEIKELVFRSRSMRQIGIALTGASVMLALFMAWPIEEELPVTPAAVVEAPTLPAPDAFANVPIQAEAAIVYDLATEKMLYGKHPDAQLPLASLTKLLAVYAALESLSPSALVTIPSEATVVDYPRAFSEGQVVPLGDLSRLVLTASLNDGAAALVHAAADSRNLTQSETLTETARTLKLTQTYALNGSGLDMNETVSGAYGSARDMAHLAGALVLRAPEIAAATTRSETSGTAENGTKYRVRNTNPMVDTFPRLLLSKTGFTDLAGGNLALVIDVGINHPVAVVVLGSSREARFTDASALVAATLAHFAGVASL